MYYVRTILLGILALPVAVVAVLGVFLWMFVLGPLFELGQATEERLKRFGRKPSR